MLDASAQDLSESGTVSFDDIDTNDVVDITVALQQRHRLERRHASTAVDDGADRWHLHGERDRRGGAGQHAVELRRQRRQPGLPGAARRSPSRYTVTATDNHGATDTDTVTFTITGTNDAPTVSATAASALHRGCWMPARRT